ncbi:hypothetical protein EV360DRAFT_80964 [Lentinula raphanica]|nr:hypothetical protein EV360DRAFT_80964 [Lentinula raphanica]
MSTEENKIVEDANAGRVTFADARHKLLLERLPEVVLKSYLVQFQQPIGGEGSDQLLVGHEDGGITPGGLDVNQRKEFRQKRAKNLGEGGSHSSHGSGGESSRRVERGEGGGHNVDPLSGLANFGPRKERPSELAVLEQQLKAIQCFISGDSGSVSVSMLDSLPHLREKAHSTGDSHIDQTLRTKRIYLNEQNLGALIDLFQTRYLPEPLPHSIWKLILKDEYISFEKLLAGIDPSYDHQDEGRDFGGGYTLVKKDHLSARKPVVSESDWNRAFDTWKNGVIQAFPHRKDELTKYWMDISNLFRNFAHDPSIPILADHELSWHLSIVLLWVVNSSGLWIRALRLAPMNVPPAQYVSIGTVGDVMIPVSMVDDTEPVQSVKRSTEPLIPLNAKPSSSPEDLETLTTGNWASEAVLGSRPLVISPLVLFSETGSTLPGPSSYVVDDSLIQVTVIEPKAYSKIHTSYYALKFYLLSFWSCHSEDSSMNIAIGNNSIVDASLKELIKNIINFLAHAYPFSEMYSKINNKVGLGLGIPIDAAVRENHPGRPEARPDFTFLLSETVSDSDACVVNISFLELFTIQTCEELLSHKAPLPVMSKNFLYFRTACLIHLGVFCRHNGGGSSGLTEQLFLKTTCLKLEITSFSAFLNDLFLDPVPQTPSCYIAYGPQSIVFAPKYSTAEATINGS